jgi:hypothetical protein
MRLRIQLYILKNEPIFLTGMYQMHGMPSFTYKKQTSCHADAYSIVNSSGASSVTIPNKSRM